MGPRAILKKKLKEEGKLDKYGRPNDETPQGWNPTKNVIETDDTKEKEARLTMDSYDTLKRKKSKDEKKEKKKDKKEKKKKKVEDEDDDVSMD